MSHYKVVCDTNYSDYGPYSSEVEAQKCAALMDLDPFCDDNNHKVELIDLDLAHPQSYEALLKIVRNRFSQLAKQEASE